MRLVQHALLLKLGFNHSRLPFGGDLRSICSTLADTTQHVGKVFSVCFDAIY